MKKAADNSAPGTTSLSTLATIEGLSGSLRLKDLSLELSDAEPPANLFTGAYGGTSGQLLVETSSAWNRKHAGRGDAVRSVIVDVDYRVDSFAKTRSPADAETVEATGWLHLDRIQSDYREELRSKWLAWIAADLGRARAEFLRTQGTKLTELALSYPQYIYKTMRTNRHLRSIGYPARLAVNPAIVLWVVSVKWDTERLHTARVRFLKDVTVSI